MKNPSLLNIFLQIGLFITVLGIVSMGAYFLYWHAVTSMSEFANGFGAISVMDRVNLKNDPIAPIDPCKKQDLESPN